MAALQDLGKKLKKGDLNPGKKEPVKDTVEYPTLTLTNENAKGLEKLALKGKVKLVFEAEVQAMESGARWGGEANANRQEVTFKLLKGSIAPAGKAPGKMSDKELDDGIDQAMKD